MKDKKDMKDMKDIPGVTYGGGGEPYSYAQGYPTYPTLSYIGFKFPKKVHIPT